MTLQVAVINPWLISTTHKNVGNLGCGQGLGLSIGYIGFCHEGVKVPGLRFGSAVRGSGGQTGSADSFGKPVALKLFLDWVAVKELKVSYHNGCVYIYSK